MDEYMCMKPPETSPVLLGGNETGLKDYQDRGLSQYDTIVFETFKKNPAIPHKTGLRGV
jgi:hypothetical protein